MDLLEMLVDSDSSGESDEDSEDEDVYEMFFAILDIIPAKECRHSVTNFCEITTASFTEREYISHLRLGRDIAEGLSDKFAASDYFALLSNEHGRKPVTAMKHIETFLWFVGHEAASYRDVANRFDMSLSTLFDIITRVSKFLCSLGLIRWPSQAEMEETKDFFYQRKGFPGIVGLIDGTHIKIDRPRVDPDSYYNRKEYFSIQAQLVCNEKYKIIDAFVGYPGSAHDARIFKNSDLYPRLTELCEGGSILGDSAYPCLPACLSPYRNNGHLTARQKNFNYVHSSCRIRIEHVNGQVKQRFRQLYNLKLRSIPRICEVIMACFALHNIANADDLAIFVTEEPLRDAMAQHQPEPLQGNEKELGKTRRDEIATLLYDN